MAEIADSRIERSIVDKLSLSVKDSSMFSMPTITGGCAMFSSQELRSELERLLKRRISSPGVIDWNNANDHDCALMNAIVNLLTTELELETHERHKTAAIHHY